MIEVFYEAKSQKSGGKVYSSNPTHLASRNDKFNNNFLRMKNYSIISELEKWNRLLVCDSFFLLGYKNALPPKKKEKLGKVNVTAQILPHPSRVVIFNGNTCYCYLT